MTLQLIRELARMAPKRQFLLLTSKTCHEELADLECANVRRVCVSSPSAMLAASDNLAISLRRLLSNLLPQAALTKLAAIYREVLQKVPSKGGLLRKLEADLLFCPFTAPFFFDEAIPTVSVVYDLQHLYYPQFFEPPDLQHRDHVFRRACALSNRIVCISDFVRETVLKNDGISPERVKTIHILLSHRLAKPSPIWGQRVLQSWALETERFLLYPANFWRHKNHELLLTAFGMFRTANPDSSLKLVLTGAPGPRRDFLMDASRKMGLAEMVVFPGYLPNGDFSVLMHSCMALIFPSLFEGFGMPLLEGMAAGKPVLCSNLTSLPEIAGDAAWMFNPKKPAEIMEAIARIERDSEFRNKLGRASARRLAAFGGPEDMAAGYLKVFDDAIQESTAGIDELAEEGRLDKRANVILGPGCDHRDIG